MSKGGVTNGGEGERERCDIFDCVRGREKERKKKKEQTKTKHFALERKGTKPSPRQTKGRPYLNVPVTPNHPHNEYSSPKRKEKEEKKRRGIMKREREKK